MPELPEVEIVRRGLEDLVVGKEIQSIDSDTPKSFPNQQESVDAFAIGARIIGVKRRAKVLLIDLSTQYTLMIHLKMTGQLVYVAHTYKGKDQDERWGAGHPNDSLVDTLPDRSTRVTITFKMVLAYTLMTSVSSGGLSYCQVS